MLIGLSVVAIVNVAVSVWLIVRVRRLEKQVDPEDWRLFLKDALPFVAREESIEITGGIENGTTVTR